MSKGYTTISEDDQRKAQEFFTRGRTLSQTGQYEYSIEMFLQGLTIDPDAVDGHRDLRDTAMKRKASGGKAMGMLQTMKLKGGKTDKEAMLNAERLLAHDPGNTDHMLRVIQSAFNSGYYDTVMWIGPLFLRANADSPKPEYSKYIALKDIYKGLKQWKLASEAAQYAVALRPDDMDLGTELKNLGAMHTMDEGNYTSGKSFRDSVKDMDKQHRLMEMDTDVRTLDSMQRQIKEAEAEWLAEPNEYGKIMRFVDALCKTESAEHENRGIELLESAFENTKQYRYKKRMGEIKIHQLQRMERSLRAQVNANPNDAQVVQDYKEFHKQRIQEELAIYEEAAENYPSDMGFRYNIAIRLFELGRYDEAIPILQISRNDPKLRADATMFLGRAFLEAGFGDEAVDTFKGLIDDYPVKGDDKSIDMTYWYGRALEAKNDIQTALKAYSQVAMWKFTYRDVQQRIKRLRNPGTPPQ